VPHTRGGASTEENVVAACGRCNTSKGRRTLTEWVHSGFAPAPAASLLAARIIDRLPV
jgi:5-methylcytosine-specific restriction endonuclease McrA